MSMNYLTKEECFNCSIILMNSLSSSISSEWFTASLNKSCSAVCLFDYFIIFTTHCPFYSPLPEKRKEFSYVKSFFRL